MSPNFKFSFAQSSSFPLVHSIFYITERALLCSALRCSVLLTHTQNKFWSGDRLKTTRQKGSQSGNTARTNSNFRIALVPTGHEQVKPEATKHQRAGNEKQIKKKKEKRPLKRQYNLPHGHSYPSEDTLAGVLTWTWDMFMSCSSMIGGHRLELITDNLWPEGTDDVTRRQWRVYLTALSAFSHPPSPLIL